MTYLSLSEYLIQTFGSKVYKLSLSSGCSCPNRDGTIAYGGCAFCSAGGSGEFSASFAPLREQMEQARARVDSKFPARTRSNRKYIAYFQSYTNTYGDVKRLSKLYGEALSYEDIVALSVGTRPDCLGEPVLDMLETLNKVKPVWVELGVQTANDATARSINRGYETAVFADAYERVKRRHLSVIVHVILGLPGETKDDMLGTVSYLSSLSPVIDGIKLQNLQILKGTAIGEQYLREPFPVFSLEEYAVLLGECLKILPKNTVIHRITGDGPKSLLIAPLWSADKKKTLNYLRSYLSSL